MDGEQINTHINNLKQRTARTGQQPTLSEVLMTQTPVGDAASKYRSLLQPSPLITECHPFGKTLKEWQSGVDVDCGPDWSREHIDLAIAQGPHRSALTPEAIDTFAEDIAYQVAAGFSEVVLLSDLMKHMPPNLKISPVAMVPQLNRRGRIILDLSFPVRRRCGRKMGPILQEAVNATTTATSPRVPVKMIGKVLAELFEYMADAPAETDILFSKIDLSDGFWRMVVQAHDKYNFCYVLPQPPGQPVRIVVPSALQMGWQESPGYFCAATETGRDLIDHFMQCQPTLPPHPLEQFIIRNVPNRRHRAPLHQLVRPWKIMVYVDDFIGAVLSFKGINFFRRFARAALYGIHAVFPPPHITGHKNGKDSVSIKKCERGDTQLNPDKEILGFDADGRARTWQLPSPKLQPIITDLRRILKKAIVQRKRLEILTGKLVNATRIAPAAKALLTPFFMAMRHRPKATHISLKPFDLRTTMRDMCQLLTSLSQRPTHVRELVKYSPTFVGMLDGSTSEGIGGVWFSQRFRPTVWRFVFPPDITKMASSGRLTINDIELAAIVTQQLVLEYLSDSHHLSTHLFCDSSTATSWATRLIAKSTTVIAGRLLRVLAMRHRQTHSPFPTVTHWPGDHNPLADTATRSSVTFTAPTPDNGRLVAAADTSSHSHFVTDLASAWRTIDDATVDVAARATAWRNWCRYIDQHQFASPYLPSLSPQERLHVLLAFAAHTRTGTMGKGQQVQTGSVSTALRYVGQTFELAGFGDPRLASDTGNLHLAFSRLYRSYRNSDPPTQSQIALPVSVFENIASHEGNSNNPLHKAAADLIIIGFFFLLRVGEYTQPTTKKRTRTVQFRLRDVTFWDGISALPFDAPLASLQAASKVTIRIDNQKNCHRDDTLTHEAIDGDLNPVAALARRFATARHHSNNDPDALLCRYSATQHVTSASISAILRRGLLRSGAIRHGFDVSRTGTHSIRASGAMALFLNNTDPILIRKLGRWRSETWLTYIHSQIGDLTKGLSRQMRRPILFHNVAVRTST